MNKLLQIIAILLFAFGVALNVQSQCTVDAVASSTDVLCGDTVKLTAVGSGVLAFRNNFNCGQVQCPEGTDKSNPDHNFGTWSNSSTAQFDNPCVPNHPSGTPHIWFNNASPSPRTLETQALPLENGGSVIFDMRMADPDLNGNASPCENPDAAGEGVHVQYSVNGGPWIDLEYYSPGNGNDPERTVWTTYKVAIDKSLGLTNNTRIRWAQLENSGTLADNLDHWGLDNLEVIANPPNATYTWTHTGVALSSGNTPDVVPTSATTYSVSYNDGVNTCTDNVTVNVRRQTLNVEALPAGPYCPGDDVTLVAEAEIDLPVYNCGLSTECQGSTRTENLGLGTLTNGNYQALGTGTGGGVSSCLNGQGNYTQFARTQFIIRASEFSAFLEGGQIYQVSLNSATAGDWPNFTIAMGCTNKQAFASSAQGEFVAGLPVVYNAKNTNLRDGWNELALDNNFEWDGVSNIVVQICWRGANRTGQFRKTNTPFTSVVHTSSCTNMDCGGYLAGNAVADNNRPSFKVDMCYRLDPKLDYVWTPTDDLSDPNKSTTTSTPTQSRTYTVTVSDKNAPPQCAVSATIDVDLISLGAFTPTYNEPWCVGTDLVLDAGVSGAGNYAWTGPNGFTSNQESPTITAADAAAAGEYEVTVSNGNCSGSAKVVVAIEPAPNAGVGRDTIVCQSSNTFDLNLIVSGADGGGVWIEDATGDTLPGSNLDLQGYAKASLPDQFGFTYSLTTVCGTDQAPVQVTINPQYLSGDDNLGNICESIGTVDLANYRLGNFEEGGRWEDPDNTGQLSGSVLNTTDLGFGEYDFWYIQDAVAPCVTDTAVITLTIQNQPYAGVDGVGNVCINQTTDLFGFLANNPDGNGAWTELTNSGGVLTGSSFDATNVPAGTYRFKYEIAAVDPCIASAAFVDLAVNDNPLITELQTNCDASAVNYIVTFKITNGDPSSYSVDYPGNIDANGVYTSNPIPSQTLVTITVSDDNNCGGSSVTVSKKCDCATAPSQMKTDTLVRACEGQAVTGISFGGFVNDGNDVQKFYLHDGSGPQLVGIKASSDTTIFNFDPLTLNYEQTYYVSPAAGDDDGTGFPDPNDPCYIVGQGTPVVFHKNPTTTISVSPNPICPGGTSTLTVNPVGGTAPFDIDIADGGAGVFIPSAKRSDNVSISALTNTTYTVNSVQGANGCVGAGNSVTLDVNEAPTATLVNGQGCGILGSNLQINVTGSGTLWDVVLTNENTGANQTLSGITAAGYSGAPPAENDSVAVVYSLVSVTDNSGSICPGVVSGSYTVNPPVSGRIVGVDSTYCQGNPIQLEVELTGIGPWSIVFNDGVGGTHNANANSRRDVILLPNGLAPGNYNFTMTSIVDQTTNCSGNGSGNALVTINPGPNAQVGFNLQDPVDNNPTKSTTICIEDIGSIDFQYLGGTGTLTVNWTIDGVAQAPISVDQGTKTTVPFNTNSITGARNIVITSVTDNTAAGCTGGGDAAVINVKNPPSASMQIPPVVCEGSPVSFTYNLSGEGTVSFDIIDDATGNVVSTVSGAAGNNQTGTFPNPGPGSYTYSIDNITDGGAVSCSGSNFNTYSFTVDPSPTIDVANPTITVCFGDNVSVPYDIGSAGNYDLTFQLAESGGGTQTINITATNDGQLALNNLSPGTYTLTCQTIQSTSGAMCSNSGTGSTQIVVNASATVTALGFTTNPVCANEQTNFTFQINGNGPYDVTYEDGLGNSFNETVDASGAFTSAGFIQTTTSTYRIVTILDGNNPKCPVANLPATAELVVNTVPSIDFTAGDIVCENETPRVTYNIGGGNGAYSIDYQDQNSTIYTGNLNNASGTFPFTGLGANDSLRLTPVSITNTATGCVGAGGAAVDVISKPNPAVQIGYVPDLGGCAPFSPVAYFDSDNNYDTRTASWTWNYNGSTQNNGDSLFLFLPNPSTSLRVNLGVSTIHGCQGQDEVVFTAYSQPEASYTYGPGEPTTMQSDVSFRSTSTSDARSFQWTVDGVVVSSAPQFLQRFGAEQRSYEVCLQVANAGGCIDEYCQMVDVKGVLQVFIPNSFTPDGDGINDVFRPVVNRALEGEYTLEIYNRWGELVFETKDPDQGWDGLSLQKEKAQVGMYVYRIRLISAFNNKEIFQEHGNILLTK